MRPKFVAIVLLLVIGLLVMVALVQRGLHPKPATPTADTGDDFSPRRWHESPRTGSEVAKGGDVAKINNTVATSPLDANGRPPGDVQRSSEDADTAQEEYVRQQIKALDELARERNADSLNAILLELQNPNKEIRKGALEAAIEFRDRSSIPRLQEIAGSTQDPNEKAELLEAIEYLKLPTLTEHLAELQANAANAKPADNAASISNRWSRKPKTEAQGLPANP